MGNLAVLGVNLAVVAVLVLTLWRYCVMIRDVSMIDAFWSFGMVVIAATTFVMAEGTPERKMLLLGLTTLWGLRLSVHLFLRWRKQGADPRYVAILGRLQERTGWSFAKASLIQIFLLQGLLQFIVSLPAQMGQFASDPMQLGWMAWTGTGIALLGIFFEAVGDAQLAAFRRNPENRGKVLNTGLWRYTRHPNYFGDALTWWGIWLVAAETRPGLWTMACPILMTWLLTRLSGVPMLERSLKKTRPGYEAYVQRTSSFIPWPPRRV